MRTINTVLIRGFVADMIIHYYVVKNGEMFYQAHPYIPFTLLWEYLKFSCKLTFVPDM